MKPALDSFARVSWIALVLIAAITLASAYNLADRSPDPWSRSASSAAAKPAPRHAALTLAERIAYQRVIEKIYWRHRIWPKERPDSKPSLDAVMSQTQLEKKVEDYLRYSQTLEDSWQRPITAEQLQAEMDRMAKDTKRPEVLRELFEALGNDPFVVAECLARPVFAGRLTGHSMTGAERSSFRAKEQLGCRSGRNPAALRNANSTGSFDFVHDEAAANPTDATYQLPEIHTPNGCTDDTWTATGITNAPYARAYHTAVWTGSEMIVWGGLGSTGYSNTGGRYDPATDSWTDASLTNVPSERADHTAVWTGSEMIVWGGGNGTVLNTGGRYNPGTDSWTATSTSNAPSARWFHTAIWTGSEMIVWGGVGCCGYLNTGGRYNPSTDSWTAANTTNAPSARYSHTAVWTSNEMIIWGGYDGTNSLNTGGRYNPGTNSWTATTSANAPTARWEHTTVWTGNEMIVWGGVGCCDYLNTGGRYNAGTNSWTATNTNNAPSARNSHTAVWSSSEMFIWGGQAFETPLNTGGRYCATAAGTTPTPTATATPRPSPTQRPTPAPRLRPNPPPRP